jgi:MFS family permease
MLVVGIGGLVFVARREQPGRRAGIAPLVRSALFRIPAFSAGLAVQVAFAAGLQGFFLAFALWLQAGQRYSALEAGLTTVAFSVGSFLLAPVAVPLAQRHGRVVLSGGALLLAVGIVAVAVGASAVGVASNPWPIVPGLVLAGAGLSLLVIPLVNVVLAAVPAAIAGGASGVFSTAQQIGGAIGVAIIGSVFFARLETHSFTDAFEHSMPLVAALFVAAAALALALPRTAVSEEAAPGHEGGTSTARDPRHEASAGSASQR